MINKQTTLGELEKIFEDLRTTQTDEYDLVLDEEAFRKIFIEALMKHILNEEVDIEVTVPAYKIYYIEYEEYLPYSIAGIYSGTYKEIDTKEEETEATVRIYTAINGGLEFEIEDW